MKKITSEQLDEMRRKGISVLDGITGKPLDFALIEKKKDREDNQKLYKDIQALILSQAETMTAIIGQLQTMNESLMTELKKHAPKTPEVTVKPQIQVDAPKVEPKIEVNVPEQKPTAWKHKITSTNAAGRPLEIVSVPTEDVSLTEESGMKYKKGAE